MPTIGLTLNESMQEVIQEIEAAYKPMSRSEILKMIIAEFYNARFTSSGRGKSKQPTQKNIKLVDIWLEDKQEPELDKGDLEEAFGDWWSQNKKNLRD